MNDMRPSPKRTTPSASHGGRAPVSPRTSDQHPIRRRSDSHKTISINLSLPHVPTPKPLAALMSRFKRISRKRKLLLLVGVIALVLIINQVSARMSPTGTSATAPNQQNPLDMLEKGNPSYKTLLPEGKSIDELNGFRRISPKNAAPVYAYADEISGATVRVSQLPLPDELRSNTDKAVKSIAAEQNATRTISVGNTKVYLGNQSNGYQPVVFVKDSLLVTIRATGVVSDDDWKAYIESLR